MTALPNDLVLATSCLMAITLQEPGYEAMVTRIALATKRYLSAVSQVELGIVAANRAIGPRVLDLLSELELNISAFDTHQADLAIAAFGQFGKGRHKAGLNFGDCCAYALAKSLNLPLLFKGNDFSQTDITSALV